MQFCIATKQCVILALSYLLSVYLPNSSKEVYAFTAFNKTLVGFAYNTTENEDWLQCIQTCHQDVSCISYNFWRGKASGTCQLNNCGFENECSAESSLIWAPGCIFQQVEPIQNIKSRCDHYTKRVNFKKNETGVVNASFSCTQKISIYADGDQVTFMNSTKPVKDINCSHLLPSAINFAILSTTQVVAIAAKSNKDASIIGSFSDGVATDSSLWKCSSDEVQGWELPGYVDSHWVNAEERPGTGGTDDQITGILPSAKWIKSEESGQIIYCRLRRGEI